MPRTGKNTLAAYPAPREGFPAHLLVALAPMCRCGRARTNDGPTEHPCHGRIYQCPRMGRPREYTPQGADRQTTWACDVCWEWFCTSGFGARAVRHPDTGVPFPTIDPSERRVRVASGKPILPIPPEFRRPGGWTVVYGRSHLWRPKGGAMVAVVCSCDPTKVTHVEKRELTTVAIPQFATCGCHRLDPGYDGLLSRLKSTRVGAIPPRTKFGDWVVVRKLPAVGNHPRRNQLYECMCVCGTIGRVTGRVLRQGVSTHCGCQRYRPDGEGQA